MSNAPHLQQDPYKPDKFPRMYHCSQKDSNPHHMRNRHKIACHNYCSILQSRSSTRLHQVPCRKCTNPNSFRSNRFDSFRHHNSRDTSRRSTNQRDHRLRCSTSWLDRSYNQYKNPNSFRSNRFDTVRLGNSSHNLLRHNCPIDHHETCSTCVRERSNFESV